MKSIEGFKNVALSKPDLSPCEGHQEASEVKDSIDLNQYAVKLREAYLSAYTRVSLCAQEQTDELYDLYPCNFLRACSAKLRDIECLGYNTKHQSLAIILKSGDKTQAIATRRLRDEAGNIVEGKKWIRAKGSNNGFIPHRFNKSDDVVFIAEGIGEVGLFEILKASYVCFQNAGEISKFEYSPLKDEILEGLKGKRVICFVDNDEPSQNGFNALYPVIGGDLYQVRFKDKPKGYDLRDLIVELSGKYNHKELLKALQNEIKARQERV